MATKAQKAAQKILKERQAKSLAKIEKEKKAAAAEKRKAKVAEKNALPKGQAIKDDFYSTVMKKNKVTNDLLTEISITLNSILDHLQSQGGILHGGDADINIHTDGDIDTSDDDPLEGSAQEQEPDNIDAAHMKQAVRIALAKVGSNKVTELFKKFKIDRISDLKEIKYSLMLDKLEAL